MISVDYIMNALEHSKVRLPFFDTPCIIPGKETNTQNKMGQKTETKGYQLGTHFPATPSLLCVTIIIDPLY